MDSLPLGFNPDTTPTQAPPPGIIPNLVDPPSQAAFPRNSVYATLPIMVIFVVIRLTTRLRMHQLGTDDYLSLLAAVISVAFCALLLAEYSNEVYGRHSWNVPVSAITSSYLVKLVSFIVTYNFATLFTKISLFALYFRLFKVSTGIKWLIWIGIILMSIFHVVSSILTLIYCVPRKKATLVIQALNDPRKCSYVSEYVTVAAGIVGTFFDFYLLVLPLSMVLRLKLSFHKRLHIAAIFSVGLVACGFSIAGTYFRFTLLSVTVPDDLWPASIAEGFSAIEINVGLTCCCLPASMPLFKSLSISTQNLWLYGKRNVGSRTRLNITYGPGSGKAPSGQNNPNELRDFPKSRFTGFRSMIQGSLPHQLVTTHTDHETQMYIELTPTHESQTRLRDLEPASLSTGNTSGFK